MSEKTAKTPNQGPSPIGEISQEPSAMEVFLDANQKKLVIIGILAILCLIGYVVFDGLRSMAQKDAAAAVSAARTVPEYDAVAKANEGTNAGGSALLLKANLLWTEQQQQEAITAVESFISGYPEHPALGNAYATLGSYRQQLGEGDAARAAFEKAASLESSASSLALLSLGDLALNAGENEKAEETYKKIISEYAQSHLQVKNMAEQRLKLIGVKAPTEKAPEPPKPTTPPTPTTPPVMVPQKPAPAITPPPTVPETEAGEGATDLDLPEIESPAKKTAPIQPEEESAE